MTSPLARHQIEIQGNLKTWRSNLLLQEIYRDFYSRILALVDSTLPGRAVEIGSGLGSLKGFFPDVISTDLFPNPWIDVCCDGYELPFQTGTISHLMLLDVFHHLKAPKAFLKEARRVLVPRGRIILCEPYISLSSFPVYGLFHPEPIGWRNEVAMSEVLPRPRAYYAAQGNATRLFFRGVERCPDGWSLFHLEAFSCFSYLLSGGFSRPGLYPLSFLPWLQKVDRHLSHWPKLFGGRCVIGLQPL